MSNDVERLLAAGLILKVDVDLGPRRMALRRLFVAEEMRPGVDSVSTTKGAQLLSEYDELGTIFAEFIAGRPVGNIVIDVSPPAGEGLRKFKTMSFRFWGWAADDCTLILVRVAAKSALKARRVNEREQGRLALDWMRSNRVTQVDRRPWYDLFAL